MTRSSNARWQALLLATALGLGGCAGLHGGKTGPQAAANNGESAPPAAAPAAASKGDPQQRFEAALQLMKTHQDDQAIAAFKQLASDFPQYSGPPTNLGILQARHKQWDAALAALQQATSNDPHNAVAYNWLGIVYRNKGDYANAERAYRQALAAQPDYADAHLNLAVLYDVYLHEPGAALTEYRAYHGAGQGGNLVEAWIKSLEQQGVTAPAAASSAPPKAVESKP